MCKMIKDWVGIIRDNKDLVVMFGGMTAAVFMYMDYKAFTKEQQLIQIEQTVVLKEITLRLSHLESQINR